MAHLVRQIARGTKAKVDNYAGPAGELVMDTTSNDLVLQTGTAGGVRMAKASTVIAASNGVEISAGGSLATGATVSGIDATTSAKGVVQLSSLTSGASETLAATEKAVGDALQAAKDYTDATVKTYTGAAPIGVSASNEISISPATTAAAGSMSAADKTKLDGIVDMTGASASAAGAHGLVPQPAAGDDAKFLKGDGTWASAGETYTAAAPISIDSNNEISVADATASSKGVVQIGDNVDVASGVISVKPWADHVANHTSAVLADYQEGAIIETDEPIYGDDAVIAPVEQTLTNAAGKVPSSAAVRAALAKKADVLAELYVSPTGSDDNDGLTAATALATPQEAMNRVMSATPVVSSASLAPGSVVVYIDEGTYTSDILVRGALSVYIVLNGDVTISGVLRANINASIFIGAADGLSARPVLTCTDFSCLVNSVIAIADIDITINGFVHVGYYSYVEIRGTSSIFTVAPVVNSGHAIRATVGGCLRFICAQVIVNGNVINSTTYNIFDIEDNSRLEFNNNLTVNVSFTKCKSVFCIMYNSRMSFRNGTATINGTVGAATAISSVNSIIARVDGTFTMSGTVTGRRYLVEYHSSMHAANGTTSATYFPGTTDGKADTETYGIYK